MSPTGVQLLARGRLPDVDQGVIAAGGQGFAVRGKSQGANSALVAGQELLSLPVAVFPTARVHRRPRRDRAAIRGKLHHENAVGIGFGFPGLLTGVGFPETDGSILGGGSQTLAVRRESHVANTIGMSGANTPFWRRPHRTNGWHSENSHPLPAACRREKRLPW